MTATPSTFERRTDPSRRVLCERPAQHVLPPSGEVLLLRSIAEPHRVRVQRGRCHEAVAW